MHKDVKSDLHWLESLRSDILSVQIGAASFTIQVATHSSFDSEYSQTAVNSPIMAFMIFTLVSLNPLVFSPTITSMAAILACGSEEDSSKPPDSMNAVSDLMAS